jgi:hypothetical protein
MADLNTTEIDKPSELQDQTYIGCQFPSRLAISGVLADCLRQLFQAPRNIMHPQLKDFFWQADDTTDPMKAPFQITIENFFTFNLTQVGVRPAILIKAGNWQESRLAIGNRSLGGTETEYYKKIEGTHTVMVVGKTVAQAELIAREVHGYLSHFGPLLRDWLSMSRWEVPMLAEPTELEENLENIVINIPVQYELIYSWTLHPEVSRLLRQISVNAIMQNTNINFQLGA